MGAGVALKAGGNADQAHRHLRPARAQVPCRDQAVAAVVAGPAQHHDAQAEHGPIVALHDLGHAGTGALHQQVAGRMTALDRVAIELAHLGGGQEEWRAHSVNRIGSATRNGWARPRHT